MTKKEEKSKQCNLSSCECKAENKSQENLENKNIAVEEKAKEQKLDPTHFGDWQVNCRTIDF